MGPGEPERLAGAWPKNHGTTWRELWWLHGLLLRHRTRTPLRYHTRERGGDARYTFFERRRLIFARRRVFLFQSSPPPVTGAGAGAGTASRTQRPSTQFPLELLKLLNKQQ